MDEEMAGGGVGGRNFFSTQRNNLKTDMVMETWGKNSKDYILIFFRCYGGASNLPVAANKYF